MKFLEITIPKERIPEYPRGKGKSKLMVVYREPFRIEHRMFYEIVNTLDERYLILLNDTKVIKARITVIKPSGKSVDFLYVGHEGDTVKGMLKGRVKKGWILRTKKGRIFEVLGRDEDGYVYLKTSEDIHRILEDEGKMPLPPYIQREPTKEDEIYYQTVYAKKEGSVAAPTAGLHFTEEILQELKNKGVGIYYITLHVGPGTFKPVKDPEKYKMESEYYNIPEDVIKAIENHKGKDGKILCVGTTTVKTLESYAITGKLSGYTDLYIKPPFEFKITDALLTNFHLPDGTPIQLVAAFLGWDKLRICYEEALKNDYMFYSYGDAMLII